VSSAYFAAEKKLPLLAIGFFAVLVYGLDLKYYLHPLSLGGRLPVLENLAGLVVFFILLAMIWLRGRKLYEAVFRRSYSPPAFILANIRINLPIVLPWLALSLVFDLLALLPWPGLQEVLASSWGDLILFGFFVCFLALFFPPLVRWLWGCRPMPPGPLRDHVESFCRAQGFHSEILYWPLFEGQVLTAAVMGIVPRFRYLMITPGLAAALDEEELDAVLAHEIGHVKRYHLVQYVLLFLGFSLLAGKLVEPLPYLLLGSDFFYNILQVFPVDPDLLLAGVSLVVLLGFMLLYFRFVFGYFIRNFERQADLYVFKVQGTARPLVSAFEKIIQLGGGSREEKNWHHFGIGERIDFLERCERNPALIRRHNTKLYTSLGAYFTIIAVVFLAAPNRDLTSLAKGYELRYAEAVLTHRLEKEPDNSLWLRMLGDLMEKKAMEKKAIEAYEKALRLDPANADLNNNLAWLLLTAKEKNLRDPLRALTLARAAVLLKEEGYILDTLAEAYFANGLYEEAVKAEEQAIRKDPRHSPYYRRQLEKFRQARKSG
jgi:Zn-dependent protease with chaperone function